jgi:capsular exopolysaccharide synthesis family protein
MKQLPEPNAGGPPARYQYVDVPPPQEGPGEPETGGLIEYWHILRRRKGTVLLFALLGTIAAILFSLPQTPIYQAKSTLEMLNINEDLMNRRQLDATTTQGYYDPQFNIKTQISILQSKTLADRVTSKLKPRWQSQKLEDMGRVAAWRKFLGLAPAQDAASAPKDRDQGLWKGPGGLGALAVRAVVGTRLVQVSYDSPDPKFAAEYVNTISSEFIDQNVEVRYDASQRTDQWLTRQLNDLKIKLERSEDELQRYARATGLQFTGEKDSVAEEKLMQLQAELSKAQADRVARQSKYELATSTPPESLPEILDDSALRDYQSKISDLRRQLAELTTTLTAEHYKVKQTQAQVTSLEAAFNKQRLNVLARIQNEFQTAGRREKLLTADYTAQSKFVSDQSEKSIHYSILKREVDTGRQIYDGMLQKVKEYGIASAMQASNVRVVDAAEPPLFPYKPDFTRNSGLGLLAGLFLGVAFVIIRERADRSIQAPGESALYVDAPELGIIPSATLDTGHSYYSKRLLHRHKQQETPDGEQRRVELVTFQRKPSLVAESFRAAVASILFSGENGNHPRVIVVTSPAPKEGKTTVTTNLALALSEINRRVLLIDADLRKPRLHNIFDVSNEHGLTDVLKAPGPLNGNDGVISETIYPGVFVMPAGPADIAVHNMLYSPRLPELIARYRKEFDAVIIDTPPMLNMSDARVLGRLSDGVIVVVRAGKTTRDTVQSAVQRFTEDGTTVIGTILNDWNPKKHQGYGYGYTYRSYHGYYDSYQKHYGPDSTKGS